MNATQPTSLARAVDPRYSSNRLVVAGSVIAALVAVGASALDIDLGFGPLSAALAVFLSWAVARELDPDRPISAALAMPAAFVFLLALGEASLIVGTALLLASRVTSGTVGADLRLLDLLAVVGLSGLLATQPVGLVGIALLLAAVMISEWPSRRVMVAAFFSVATFAIVWVLSGTELAWGTPDVADWTSLVVTLVAAALIIPTPRVTSQTDRRTGTVDRSRVTVARLLVGLAVVAAFGVAGGIGIQAVAPIAGAALVGTAARRVASAIV